MTKKHLCLWTEICQEPFLISHHFRRERGLPLNLLLLGHSYTGKQYWLANLFGFAIYNRVLTKEKVTEDFQRWTNRRKSSLWTEENLVALYPLDERAGQRAHNLLGHLLIPPRLKMLQKTIFVPPWQDFRPDRSFMSCIRDIVTNILGFMPLGFFFSAYLGLRKTRSVYRLLSFSILPAGRISLTIELAQVYLPTRASQLTDVITNMAGAALGTILFSFCNQKKQSNPSNLSVVDPWIFWRLFLRFPRRSYDGWV